YSLGWIKRLSGSDNGGFVYQLGIGVSLNLVNAPSLNLQLAYKSQDAKEKYYYYYNGYYGSETKRVQYQFFSAMLGIEF
ncbi:MAG: hypothetical protein V2A61_02785, partial [Calditrichota bacterium]